MNRKLGKTNWQLLVRKALDQERKNKRSIPSAWKEFSKVQIDILLQLQDGGISIGTLIEESDLLKCLENGPRSFIEQCFQVCMATNDEESFETKFLLLFHLVEEAIDNETIAYSTKKAVRHYIMVHSIEKHHTEFFVRFLKVLYPNHDQYVETHSNRENTHKILATENEIGAETPEINSEMLLSACKRKNYAIIKQLVYFGYR